MVSFKFTITDDGYAVAEDASFVKINHTKNRKIFKHYALKDQSGVKRFASDMLKFEDNDGPILPKEAFTTSETLVDALDVLSGMRLYVQSDTTEKDDGTKKYYMNVIAERVTFLSTKSFLFI